MYNDGVETGRFLRAMRGEAHGQRPIWLLRQAGRYMAEYRQVRAEAGDFMTMVKSPHLVAEITAQPIRRFGFDAAIIFSDILVIPDAMDLDLKFVEGKGPRIGRPLQSEDAVARLPAADAEQFAYVFDACAATRAALDATAGGDVPLIGFCGAPWTVACYMVDGGGGDFITTRAMLRSRPDLLHAILRRCADAAAELLVGQARAGCAALMIFDSWGGLLPAEDYEVFSLAYIRRIIARVAAEVSAPIIVYARGCGMSLSDIARCGCAAVGVDSSVSLATARRLTCDAVALQGNMDWAVLLSDAETVQREAARVLRSYGGGGGHIFNLGAGINKNTPVECVSALVEAVKNWRP